MPKKKRTAWIVFFIFSGIAVLIYRYEAINWIQAQLLKSIRNKTFVSNHSLLQDSSVSQHQVYTLKGIDRIWPHRVNSLQRFKYLYPEFAGFECDIQFDASSRRLYIAHDNPGTLVFTDYLRADADHKLFWLDVKNLDSNNIQAFCDQLQQLDRQFAIKHRVIIESYDTAAALRIGESGYLNSFNLHNMRDADPTGETAYIAAVKRLFPQKIKLLSQEIGMHDFMTKNFPGLKQLTWDIRFFDGMNRNILLKNANDTTLLICLVNVKSPGYR